MIDILQEKIKTLQHRLARDLDSVVGAAILHRLGVESVALRELQGRLNRVTVQGQPGEIYTLDGLPFLYVKPLKPAPLDWHKPAATIEAGWDFTYLTPTARHESAPLPRPLDQFALAGGELRFGSVDAVSEGEIS